jgi:hypothetical protein
MKKLILKLVQKYFLQIDFRFRPGDLVIWRDGEPRYEAVAVYYSYELKPFLFIRDGQGKIFGVPLNECRSPYAS